MTLFVVQDTNELGSAYHDRRSDGFSMTSRVSYSQLIVTLAHAQWPFCVWLFSLRFASPDLLSWHNELPLRFGWTGNWTLVKPELDGGFNQLDQCNRRNAMQPSDYSDIVSTSSAHKYHLTSTNIYVTQLRVISHYTWRHSASYHTIRVSRGHNISNIDLGPINSYILCTS